MSGVGWPARCQHYSARYCTNLHSDDDVQMWQCNVGPKSVSKQHAVTVEGSGLNWLCSLEARGLGLVF